VSALGDRIRALKDDYLRVVEELAREVDALVEAAAPAPAPAPSGVLTADQLDALPVGARVVDCEGDVWDKRAGGWYLDDVDVVPFTSEEVAVWAPELRP
jgi:hypothetical protein